MNHLSLAEKITLPIQDDDEQIDEMQSIQEQTNQDSQKENQPQQIQVQEEVHLQTKHEQQAQNQFQISAIQLMKNLESHNMLNMVFIVYALGSLAVVIIFSYRDAFLGPAHIIINFFMTQMAIKSYMGKVQNKEFKNLKGANSMISWSFVAQIMGVLYNIINLIVILVRTPSYVKTDEDLKEHEDYLPTRIAINSVFLFVDLLVNGFSMYYKYFKIQKIGKYLLENYEKQDLQQQQQNMKIIES